MRMLVEFALPLEPFNSLVRNGTAGATIEKILGDLKPEAVYFTERDGKRGGVMVVDLPDASKIPSIAEPFFLQFQATVAFHPCMRPEDLAQAGLNNSVRSGADRLQPRWTVENRQFVDRAKPAISGGGRDQ